MSRARVVECWKRGCCCLFGLFTITTKRHALPLIVVHVLCLPPSLSPSSSLLHLSSSTLPAPRAAPPKNMTSKSTSSRVQSYAQRRSTLEVVRFHWQRQPPLPYSPSSATLPSSYQIRPDWNGGGTSVYSLIILGTRAKLQASLCLTPPPPCAAFSAAAACGISTLPLV